MTSRVVLKGEVLTKYVSPDTDNNMQINFFESQIQEQFRAYYISKQNATANYYKALEESGEAVEDVVRVDLQSPYDNTNLGQENYFDSNILKSNHHIILIIH